MQIIHRIFLFILPYIAMLHPKNWNNESYEYPQLWYVWSGFGFSRWSVAKDGTRTRTKRRVVIEQICGFLTGHELSNTEWGYGGGAFVDRNCRWCDKCIKVHKKEDRPVTGELKDMADNLGYSE